MKTRRRRKPYGIKGKRKRKKVRHVYLNPEAEAVLEALRGYDARGVPVLLGYPEMDIGGRIDRQRFGRTGRPAVEGGAPGPGRAQFIVIFDEPISQEDYEAALGLHEGSAQRIWNERTNWAIRTDQGVLRAINGDGNLTWLEAPWYYLNIDPDSAPIGTLLEYEEPGAPDVEGATGRVGIRVYSGRFAGKLDGLGLREAEEAVLVELIEPLPFWSLPTHDNIAWDGFRPGFTSTSAYFIPEYAHERKSACIDEKLGPSKFVSDDIYPLMRALETPVPYKDAVRAIQTCLPHHELSREVASSMVLYFVLPMKWPPRGRLAHGTGIRPMRKEQAGGLEMEVFEGAEWLEGLK